MNLEDFKQNWLAIDRQETWIRPKPELLEEFYQLNIQETQPRDIVFMVEESDWLVGFATGNDNDTQTEIIESVSGTDRTRYVERSTIVGVFRPKIIESVEPAEVKLYKPPQGARHVPLAVQQRFFVKVDLKTYPTPGLAAKREKPTDNIVRQGMREFDELKYGMLKVKGEGYWINPADNVVKPTVVIRPPQAEYVPDGLKGDKEAEENYLDFTDKNGKLHERYYAAKSGGAFVIDFKTGDTRTMPEGAHVWLAGITQVGGMGYGIATKCMEMEPVRYVGIRMGELYEDDTFNPKTTVEERKLLHTLKIRDYMDQATAKLQKKFIDIKGK